MTDQTNSYPKVLVEEVQILIHFCCDQVFFPFPVLSLFPSLVFLCLLEFSLGQRSRKFYDDEIKELKSEYPQLQNHYLFLKILKSKINNQFSTKSENSTLLWLIQRKLNKDLFISYSFKGFLINFLDGSLTHGIIDLILRSFKTLLFQSHATIQHQCIQFNINIFLLVVIFIIILNLFVFISLFSFYRLLFHYLCVIMYWKIKKNPTKHAYCEIRLYLPISIQELCD